MKINQIVLPRAAKRLKAVYEKSVEIAQKDDIVVDVGADHGYLAAMFAKSEKFAKVIATDISSPSLNKTVELSQKLNLEIETRVGDGLLVAQDATMACICGMGGYEIIKILQQKNNVKKFVLMPAQNPIELRQFLLENNYKIVKDYVLKDSGKFYYLFVIDGFGKNKYSKFEKMFGKNKSLQESEFQDFVENQINKLKFLENFDINNVAKDQKKIIKQKYEYYKICKKLKNKDV